MTSHRHRQVKRNRSMCFLKRFVQPNSNETGGNVISVLIDQLRFPLIIITSESCRSKLCGSRASPFALTFSQHIDFPRHLPKKRSVAPCVFSYWFVNGRPSQNTASRCTEKFYPVHPSQRGYGSWSWFYYVLLRELRSFQSNA